MADKRVTCIIKRQRHSSHEGITHLGGKEWCWTRQRVIDLIENGTDTFHTLVNGNEAYIGVVTGPNGKYLRTHADSKWNDNLLALTECEV